MAVLCGAVLWRRANFVKLMLRGPAGYSRNPITLTVAAVICLTLVCTVFCAKLVGCIAAAAGQESRL